MPDRPAYVPVCRIELSCPRGCVAGVASILRRSGGLRRRDRGRLAIIATIALTLRVAWAAALAWLFNLWGTADLLYAFYQGLIGVGIDPAALGAAFYIPTLVVPPLLVTHAMIFWLLLRAGAQTEP